MSEEAFLESISFIIAIVKISNGIFKIFSQILKSGEIHVPKSVCLTEHIFLQGAWRVLKRA